MISPLQASPFPQPAGIPLEFWALIALIAGLVLWRFFTKVSKALPVKLIWIYRTGHALLLPAKEDIQGLYLDVKNWSGKVIEEISKTGLPVEVQEIDEKKAYLVRFVDKEKKPIPPEKRAFLDVSLGGLRQMRLYAAREGEGETINLALLDPKSTEVEGEDDQKGTQTMIHDERAATKSFLRDLAEAMAGSWRMIVLPFVAGGGVFLSVGILLLLLFGHLR